MLEGTVEGPSPSLTGEDPETQEGEDLPEVTGLGASASWLRGPSASRPVNVAVPSLSLLTTNDASHLTPCH